MRYFDSVNMHYRALWEQGIAVDFRDMRPCTDLSQYRLVVAPMLFLMKEGFSQKLRAFVENGGTLLMTCFSGVVDDSGLAYLGGAPHDLTDVLGVRATELDALYPQDVQHMVSRTGGAMRCMNYASCRRSTMHRCWRSTARTSMQDFPA